MKNIFTHLLIVILLSIFSKISGVYAKAIQVESLENQSCWLNVDEESGQMHYASFVKGEAGVWALPHYLEFENNLNWEIKKLIGDNEVEKESEQQTFHYQVYFKCDAQGARFYANLYDYFPQLCLELDLKKGSEEISLSNVLPNHEKGSGLCLGQKKGQLIINFSKEMNGPSEKLKVLNCIEKIKTFNPKWTVRELSSSGLFIVDLSLAYFYKEFKAKEELLSFAQKNCSLKLFPEQILYNEEIGLNGTWTKIHEGKFLSQ